MKISLVTLAYTATLLSGLCFSPVSASSQRLGRSKPFYAKAQVQTITVNILPNEQISIRYHVYPESNYYSDGVNYKKVGDELRVTIERCAISEKCTPMAKTVIPLDDKWEAEVHIPYHGEKVTIVHADGEEHIYP